METLKHYGARVQEMVSADWFKNTDKLGNETDGLLQFSGFL